MLFGRFKKFRDKKIVILGFGREGQDSFLFLRKLFPEKQIGIADKKNLSHIFRGRRKCVTTHFGKDYLKALKSYDIIIKSPGIPAKILSLQKFRRAGQIITSQTEIFFENCPGTIVGVTGTKGKSTTASMIHRVLKQGGLKAHLLGNIGKPVLLSLLRVKKDDIFVYELSSFQLTNLKKSPHIAVFLNIYPEHLDYYRNFEEYLKAKANITKYQTKKDYLVYNSQDPLVRKIAQKSKAQKTKIAGVYYQLDMAAAREVGRIFKIPEKNIKKAIKQFKLLPHRLELVGEYGGIKFYNDSLSTIPETTIAALDFLDEEVQTLILGGFDRGLDFKKLAKRILESKIKTLILFPVTGQRIWQALMGMMGVRHQSIRHFDVNNIREAVRLAYKNTDKGKICLLSPASPSFGIFKDYADRGNGFKKYVKKYARYARTP